MAFEFLGTDVATRASVTLGDEVTFAAWIKITSFNTFHPIFMHGGQIATGASRNRRGGLLIWRDGANSNLYWTTGRLTTQGDAAVTVTLDAGTWYHVAVTHNYATFTCQLYLNGVKVYDDVISGSGAVTPDTQTLHLGNNANVDSSLNGRMHGAAVWSRILTEAQIQEVYEGGALSESSNLYGYWRMWANPTADTADYSSNNRNATNSGGASVADDANAIGPKVVLVGVGATTATAQNQTASPTAPDYLTNDILVAVFHQNDNLVLSPPDGTWTAIKEVNNTANQRCSIFWKRATADGAGQSFTFTKSADNNLLIFGLIFVLRGCRTDISPIAAAASHSANASSDTVTYATYTPGAIAHLIAIGLYNNDLTTAGAISGTNPSFANIADVESSVGADGSIFIYRGDSNGEATGSRSHSTTSTADAISIGVLVGFLPAQDVTGTAAITLGELTSAGTAEGGGSFARSFGAMAANATDTSQALTVPTCEVGDLLVATIVNKGSNTLNTPSGWNVLTTQGAATFVMSTFYRVAQAGDSGSSVVFTKVTDDNVAFGGNICAFAVGPSVIIGPPYVGVQGNASADAVGFPAFDPIDTTLIAFFAVYGDDQTAFAAAMSADANPDCTIFFDEETPIGTGFAIACTVGLSDGANIAARTWASNSTTDADSMAVIIPMDPLYVNTLDGSLSATLGALTVSASLGELTVDGTATPTLGALTLGGTGTVEDILYGTAAITLGVCAPPGYLVGPNYHLLGPAYETDQFIRVYHNASIRNTVLAQLAGMRDAGATSVHTRLWQVIDESENFGTWNSFPFSSQELTNITQYATDVLALGMKPVFTMLWLWCAAYTTGTPATTVGACDYTWAQFLTRAQSSISGLATALTGLGGSPPIRVNLEGEMAIGATTNGEQFLLDLWPYFYTQMNAAGCEPSVYSIAGQSEAAMFDPWDDPLYPILDNHGSMFYIYRTFKFMLDQGWTLPSRLDISLYFHPISHTPDEFAERCIADFEAVLPGYTMGVAETFNEPTHGQAWVKAFKKRNWPTVQWFWPITLANLDATFAPWDIEGFLPDRFDVSGFGDVEVQGTSAVTLSALALAGAGVVTDEQVSGTASITLGALTVSASLGELTVDGVAAITLGALTLDADGEVTAHVEGVASITLGALTISVSLGELTVDGALTVTLGALTLDGDGEQEADTEIFGALAVTLGALTLASDTAIEVQATSAITLDAATLDADGEVTEHVVGTLAVTLGALTVSASLGELSVDGVVAVTLGALTVSASSGEIQVGGALASSLDSLVLVSTGALILDGALATTLGALTVSASLGQLTVEGAAAVTLGALTLTAAGVQEPPVLGELTVTLGACTLVATGEVTIHNEGTLTKTLGVATLVASGVQTEGIGFWDGCLIQTPTIIRSRTEITHGYRELSRITLRLANDDGTYSSLYDSENRKTRIRGWSQDVESGQRLNEFRGVVTRTRRAIGEVALECSNLDIATLETPIPQAIITTEEFGTDCPSAGEHIVELIGNVPKVRLPWIKDDKINSKFWALFPIDTPSSPTVTLYREAPTAEGSGMTQVISPSEYTISTALVPGRVVVAFTVRQEMFGSTTLHTIRADITGTAATRNPWRAIQDRLTRLGRQVNTGSFAAAIAGVPAGLVVDGLIDDVRPAIDWIDELLMVVNGTLELGPSGWEAVPDTQPTEASLLVDDALDDGERNLVEPDRLERVTVEDQVSIVRCRGRYDYLREEFVIPTQRPVWFVGKPKEYEFRLVRDATALDMICHRLGLLHQYGAEEFHGTLSPDALNVFEGDIIIVNYAPFGLVNTHMFVSEIDRDTFKIRAHRWHPNLYGYIPGVLPADLTIGTESDYSRVAPASVTSLSIVSSGTRQGSDGKQQAFVRLQFTTPTSNYSKASIEIRRNGQTAVRQQDHVGTGTVIVEIDGLVPSAGYDYLVWSVNAPGNLRSTSATTISNNPAPNDTIAPATPTSIMITPIPGKLARLRCTLGAESDLKGVQWEVWTGASRTGSKVAEGTIAVAPGSSIATGAIAEDTLEYGTVYHASTRAFDSTSNPSGWSASSSFAYEPQTTDDLDENGLFNIGIGGSGEQFFPENAAPTLLLNHVNEVLGPNSIVTVRCIGVIHNQSAVPWLFLMTVTAYGNVMSWYDTLPAGAMGSFNMTASFANRAADPAAEFQLHGSATGAAGSPNPRLVGAWMETVEMRRRTA